MTYRASILLFAIAVAATACDNGSITDVNNNPNSPTTAPASAVFTNAARLGASRWLGTTYDQRAASFVIQHLAEAQYPDEDAYKRIQAAFTAATFDGAYTSELEDLQQVIRAGTSTNAAGIYGPALAMRTWEFSYLTDSWGDVPYFQSLSADSAGGTLSPAYDAQKDIYADFFKTLDKVSKDLAAAGATGNLATADPIYSGSFVKWERFANSLRARLALRLSNVDPATAKAEFTAAMAAPGGLLTSNADNAKITWPGDGVYDNPWAGSFKARDDYRVSKTLMDILKGNNDPRLPVYAMPTDKNGDYVGLVNALSQGDAVAQLATTSRPGAILYPGTTTYGTFGSTGGSWPSFLMTFAEVSFMKAEAAERGWITGSASQFYADGINASMDQWGVTDQAAINTYIASANVAYAAGTEGLKRIAIQKYLALFTDGGTAWAEWRRTCQPATIKPGPTAIISTIPRRLEYSTTEQSVNAEALAAAVSRQGADDFTSRVYWDTKPTSAPTYVAGCGQR